MKIEQRSWTRVDGWRVEMPCADAVDAQLVFLFGDRERLQEGSCVRDLLKVYPAARIVGCSTAGEILGAHVRDGSLAVTAVRFERTEVCVTALSITEMRESDDAGRRLAAELPRDGLRHVLVFSDGLHVNGSALAKGLRETLPTHVAVTGGLAGDQSAFTRTVIVVDEKVMSDAIVAVGFYGDNLKIGYGSLGGWDSFGQDRLVTRANGNMLYELDGQPALDLYKKYLGPQAQGLPATGLLFPLSVRIKDRDTMLVRTILAVNEEDKSMTFAGDVPQGSYVRLMKANFDRLVSGAEGAAEMSRHALESSAPELALLISCVGRKLVLKQRVEEEVESAQQILSGAATITGFYSYGELCPTSPDERQCELHNQTMTITTFSER